LNGARVGPSVPGDLRWIWLTPHRLRSHRIPDPRCSRPTPRLAGHHFVPRASGHHGPVSSTPLPMDRVHLIKPRPVRWTVGDRRLTAVKPPVLRQPRITTGLRRRPHRDPVPASDCFGALLPEVPPRMHPSSNPANCRPDRFRLGDDRLRPGVHGRSNPAAPRSVNALDRPNGAIEPDDGVQQPPAAPPRCHVSTCWSTRLAKVPDADRFVGPDQGRHPRPCSPEPRTSRPEPTHCRAPRRNSRALCPRPTSSGPGAMYCREIKRPAGARMQHHRGGRVKPRGCALERRGRRRNRFVVVHPPSGVGRS